MRLTDKELAELEQLEREATPGPWVFRDDSCGEYRVLNQDCKLVFNKDFDDLRRHLMPPHEEDARLFVAARNALPSLLAEVRELRAAVAAEARINVAQLGELYELRAFKAQIKAVK